MLVKGDEKGLPRLRAKRTMKRLCENPIIIVPRAIPVMPASTTGFLPILSEYKGLEVSVDLQRHVCEAACRNDLHERIELAYRTIGPIGISKAVERQRNYFPTQRGD